MNEKSTVKKRTETKTLKRIYKILMELRKLDEHWECEVGVESEFHNSDGSLDKKQIVETAKYLLDNLDYSLWHFMNVVDYGYELTDLLHTLGCENVSDEWIAEKEEYESWLKEKHNP